MQRKNITITGATTIPRRDAQIPMYSPKIVVRLGVLVENTSNVPFIHIASTLFKIYDSNGKELDLYPLDESLDAFVKQGVEEHGPVYFAASGQDPYIVTLETAKEKVSWIMTNEEVGIHIVE